MTEYEILKVASKRSVHWSGKLRSILKACLVRLYHELGPCSKSPVAKFTCYLNHFLMRMSKRGFWSTEGSKALGLDGYSSRF